MTLGKNRVYVVQVNWNGWRDTIECLESVLRCTYPNYEVVVCDNGSTDQSLARIKAWAAGQISADTTHNNPTRRLSFPPIPKPLDYVELDCEFRALGERERSTAAKLILIDNHENLGFAKGSNVGIRYALSKEDCAYIWLLNTDTVVAPDALGHLVARIQCEPRAGLCGSTLLYYSNPKCVQALCGATFNKWLASSRHIGAFQRVERVIDPAKVEAALDYVVGASMLVSRSFVEEIGLMSEDYFLYFEEIDWATRARAKYKLVYAHESIVYHKEGASIGSSSNPRDRSLLAEYYGLRNRIVYTRKYFRRALPTVYLGVIIALIRRAIRGQWDKAGMAWKVMWTT
jgi:GT2 family glycosyltransferase